MNDIHRTPSSHRTRLGVSNSIGVEQATSSARGSRIFSADTLHSQTPSTRRQSYNASGTPLGRSAVSGYGMSAGMKVGRQQGMIVGCLFGMFLSGGQD